MNTLIIRKPGPSEYEIWVKTYQSFLDFYQTGLEPEELQKVWSWISESHVPSLHCYFAEFAGEVIGLAHFREHVRPINASTVIYLDDLIVLPEHQGKGIGNQLIQAIKAYAKANNRPLIRWIIAKENLTAMRLYDSIATKTEWVTYETKINE